MMSHEMILATVAPEAAKRARRLQMALRLLNAGVTPSEVRARVRDEYQCSRCTAWRVVSQARDMTP